jgi:hypothetical protein
MNIATYKTKETYLKQINSISVQYNSMLNDYKTKYINSNQSPSDKSKKRFLDESSLNLTKKFNELVSLQTEITRINSDISTDIIGINKKINNEKEKNTEFKKNLTALDPIKSSAIILISDYKTNYNDSNIKNWSLLIGIIVSCAIITYMFRIPTTIDGVLKTKDETINKLYKEGTEYASKYEALKEKGKQKAAEAEAKINTYYQDVKKYKKRADELYLEKSSGFADATKVALKQIEK